MTRETATTTHIQTDKAEVANRGIFARSILEHRALVYRAEPMHKPANVPYVDIEVPISNHVQLPARVYRPHGYSKKEPLPTLFYVPGTAFIAVETKFTHLVCSHICEQAQCQIIVINHRLAPEEQFPVGLHDAYRLLNFFTKIAPEFFNIDPNRVVISGYSSGGNFAALMAIQAKKENINVRRQILVSPFVDLSRSLNAFKEYEEKDTDIKDEFVKWFLKLYIPPNIDRKHPSLSPFWVKQEELKGLPPTDIMLAEYDRFRSDAEGFYTKLKEAGVDTSRYMFENEKHSYLWYKLEVIDKITERLKIAFQKDYVPNNNRLLIIKPDVLKIHPELRAYFENESNNDKQQQLVTSNTSAFTLSRL